MTDALAYRFADPTFPARADKAVSDVLNAHPDADLDALAAAWDECAERWRAAGDEDELVAKCLYMAARVRASRVPFAAGA